MRHRYNVRECRVQVAEYINWLAEYTAMTPDPGDDIGLGASGDGKGTLVLRPKPTLYRFTGAGGDDTEETSPDVSDDGMLVFVASTEQDNGSSKYEIQITDASVWAGPVYTSFTNEIYFYGDQIHDFDGDPFGLLDYGSGPEGSFFPIPDALKLLAIHLSFQDPGFCSTPVYISSYAGVDWDEVVLDAYTMLLPFPAVPHNCTTPPFTDVIDYLIGSEPDGVTLEPMAYMVELGELTEMWDPAWSPTKIEVLESDYTTAEYPWLVLANMKNSVPGAAIGRYNIILTVDGTYDPWGACIDMDWNDNCDDLATDPVFSPLTNTIPPQWVDIEGRLEYFSLSGLVVDPTNNYAQFPLMGSIDGTLYVVEPEENAFVAQPAVSPDGDRVVYVSGARSHSSGDMLRGDLYSFDVYSGFLKRLTYDQMYNRGPMWVEQQ